MPKNSHQTRLNPTSYTILGLLALRGPSSPYDLKRAIGHLRGVVIPVSHTQIYGETARLAAAGLLNVEQKEKGRRRQSYEITEAGREALMKWMDEPTEPPEIRDMGQFKLLLSEFRTPEQVQQLARGQALGYREALKSIEAAEERFQGRPEYRARMLALPLGRRFLESGVAFWEHLAEHPPAAEELRGPKTPKGISG